MDDFPNNKASEKPMLILCLLLAVFLSSCFPNFESTEQDRLYIKSIQVPIGQMDWFFYSTIGGSSADYVLVTTSSGVDTLCITTNLHDVQVPGQDTIVLYFTGLPRLYQEAIKVKEIDGFEVKTINVLSSGPANRKFFRKEG